MSSFRSIREQLHGEQKTRSRQDPTVIPRLPAIRPRVETRAGTRLRATPITQPDIFGGEQLRGIDLKLKLSPEIRALRQESLAGTRGLLEDVQGDIQTLRGIENPFVQARVAPFVAQREMARRDAARRGVSGPLSALAINPFQTAIAEQGALATFDAQQAIRGAQEFARALLSDISGQGRLLLEQELRLLGLAQAEIEQIIQSQLTRPALGLTESEGRAVGRAVEPIDPNQMVSGFGAMMGGGGGGGAAGGGAAAAAGCWVAREVYGIDNIRWVMFRRWMLNDGPKWFRRLYLNYGERFAAWIRNKPRLKRIIRWGMDKVLNHG